MLTVEAERCTVYVYDAELCEDVAAIELENEKQAWLYCRMLRAEIVAWDLKEEIEECKKFEFYHIKCDYLLIYHI